MTRKEKLADFLAQDEDDRQLLSPLLDEFLFLEEQLTELKKLPFIKTRPDNPQLQKATPAAKQYKDLLQQYTNIIKILSKRNNDDPDGKESPLREWVKKHGELK